MARKYMAMVEVTDRWEEGDPSPEDMQVILNQAFEYQDCLSAKVVGAVSMFAVFDD